MSFYTPSEIENLEKFEVLLEQAKYDELEREIADYSTDNLKEIINIFILKSLAAQGLGKYEIGVKFAELAVRKAAELKYEILSVKANTILASSKWKLGAFDDALVILHDIIKHLNEKGNKTIEFYRARAHMVFANIAWSKGFYSQATEYTKKAIEIWEQLDQDMYLGFSLNNIGYINLFKGNLKESIDYYLRGLALIRNYQLSSSLSHILLNIVYAYVQLNEMEQARVYIEEMEEISNKYPNNDVVRSFYDLAQAYYYKYSSRLRNLMKAEVIFSELRKRKSLEFQYQRLILIHLTEIYLIELSLGYDAEIIEDINNLIQELHEMNPQSGSEYFIVEVSLLKAKLYELEGNTREALQIVNEALEICSKHDFKRMARELIKIQKSIDERSEILDQLDHHKIDAQSIENMRELVDNIIHFRLQYDKKSEIDPIYFQIIDISGINVFTKVLDPSLEMNENLLSSFLSAINSFSKQTFKSKGSMELIRLEEYEILFDVLYDLMFIFIYRGKSIESNIKFKRIINKIDDNVDILKIIEGKHMLNSEITQKIENIITEELGLPII
ncbi:MAG: hypothetical protein INQ03_20715 [Candidatus Heimdallarchaeota archaeon]|nr:hypothetical protein [Candidatus Heimdallarchaeota archaeon]